MVTAPAPATLDSHALPQAGPGAASNSPKSLDSFLSIIESLPAHGASSADSLLQPNPTSKTLGNKKSSSKDTDNNLVAIVSPTTVDPAQARPLVSAHPSFSLTMRDHASADPAASEHAQPSPTAQDTPEKVSSVLNRQIQSGSQAVEAQPTVPVSAKYLPKSDVSSSARESAQQENPGQKQTGSKSSFGSDVSSNLQADLRSSAPGDFRSAVQLRTKPAAQAGLNGSVPAEVRASVDPVSTPVDTESTKNAPAKRGSAPSSTVAASTPSFSIGAPALPLNQEVSRRDPEQSAIPSRPSRQGAAATPDTAVDPALFTKSLAATLSPRQDNLAFSLKMAETNATARHAQQATQPHSTEAQATERSGLPAQAKTQERPAANTTQPSAAHAASAPGTVTGEVAAAATTVNHPWNTVTATPQTEIRPEIEFSEARPAATLNSVSSMHEAQHILPEAPRPAATAAEIMLQLGGKDQAAAIRVTDRAGTINVSVHAADADLRTSLRSNLGDLASQLSHQGWKTEVVKTGTVLARAEASQDPQQGGQRSPGQQQSFSQGDRQPQRDRRSNSGQWLTEFEEQASGNSGGKK